MAGSRHDEAIGRRFKAVAALNGWKLEDDLYPLIAEAISKSDRVAQRVASGERHLKHEEFAAVAEQLDVPEWFLRDGFSGAPHATVDLATVAEELARHGEQQEQSDCRPRAD